MEGNLIATWFAKLVDALRINKRRLSADKMDAPGDRLVQTLKVAIDGLYNKRAHILSRWAPFKVVPGSYNLSWDSGRTSGQIPK